MLWYYIQECNTTMWLRPIARVNAPVRKGYYIKVDIPLTVDGEFWLPEVHEYLEIKRRIHQWTH